MAIDREVYPPLRALRGYSLKILKFLGFLCCGIRALVLNRDYNIYGYIIAHIVHIPHAAHIAHMAHIPNVANIVNIDHIDYFTHIAGNVRLLYFTLSYN